MEKYLKRLCKAILAGRFNDENYWGKKLWYGKELQAEPLFCSYGAIGFTVSVYDDYHHFCDVQWDGDLHELTIDGEPWKDYINILHLENNDICKVNETPVWDIYPRSVELECYTDAGGDMIINLEEPTKECLEEYLENFDIDEEIMLWWGETTERQREQRGLPFDNIREHYDDLESWKKHIKKACEKMPF